MMLNKLTDKQSIAISITRVIAIILIVSCHFFQSFGNKWAWVLNVGVQIFLFMSGFLHGVKKINNPVFFFASKIKRVYIPYILYMSIVLTCYPIFQGGNIGIVKVLGYVFVLQVFTGALPGLEHLWFISVIFICYALTPVVQLFNHKYNLVFLLFFCLGSIVWFSFVNLFFQLSVWIFTYFLGYLISYYFDNKKTGVVNFCFIAAFLLLLPFYEIHSGSGIDTWIHVIAGGMIFLVILNLLSNEKLPLKKNRFLHNIDNYSYEIYLTHHIFILGPFAFINISMTPNIIAICLILIVVLLLSYCLKFISIYVIKHLESSD